MTAETLSWREERRQDALLKAQIAREDAAARAQAARDDQAARVKASAVEARARQERKAAARRASAARRAVVVAWVSGNAAGLLLVPVILVPAVLSWTGMAAWGVQVYGPRVGWSLPALSEGGMWAFAAACTIRHRQQRPVPFWWRAGAVIFAGIGGALNYLHGVSSGSTAVGVTMAIVSVSGVTAHQLITATPMLTRAERAQRSASRHEERRLRAARKAAVTAAQFEITAEGHARLIFHACTATLDRHWLKARLVRIPQVNAPNEESGDGSVLPPANPPVDPSLAQHDDPIVNPSGDPQDDTQSDPSNEVKRGSDPDQLKDRPRAPRAPRGRRPAKPRSDRVTALLRAGLSTAEIHRRTGASESTIKRRRATLRNADNVVPIHARREA